MIVLDASAVVELLTSGPLAGELTRALAAHGGPYIAPHLLDVEVTSAFRNLAAGQPGKGCALDIPAGYGSQESEVRIRMRGGR